MSIIVLDNSIPNTLQTDEYLLLFSIQDSQVIQLHCDNYSSGSGVPIYFPANMLIMTITELIHFQLPIY